MLFWIFDLDYTLYNIPKNIGFQYKYIYDDNYLGLLLSFLPQKKIVYTNSNTNHCNLCLDIMNIKNKFNKIVTRDNNKMKPYIESYENFMYINNIKSNDTCIFFEDTEINLFVAKKFGWITVYIGEKNSKPYIDFSFITIHEALEYFIKNKL